MIKVGGNELDQPDFRDELASVLIGQDGPVVLIHGGGKAVDELHAQFDLQSIKIRGMRYTDSETLRITMMVLCGWVNKTLVASLITAGIDAVGLSGVDGGLIRVQKMEDAEDDLGLVGEVVSVRADLLEALLDQGLLPVVAPISLGIDGRIYNVNADQAAGAIALALHADSLDFVSSVPGVVREGMVASHLHVSEVKHLITSEEINGGMIPKVTAALQALRRGIPRVRIVDLDGLKLTGGTTFTVDLSQNLPSHSEEKQ